MWDTNFVLISNWLSINSATGTNYSISGIVTLQPRYAEERLWTHDTLNPEAEGQDHTRCCSCQLKTENWGYNSHSLIKVKKQKNVKMLPGLKSHSFCCDDGGVIWIGG